MVRWHRSKRPSGSRSAPHRRRREKSTGSNRRESCVRRLARAISRANRAAAKRAQVGAHANRAKTARRPRRTRKADDRNRPEPAAAPAARPAPPPPIRTSPWPHPTAPPSRSRKLPLPPFPIAKAAPSALPYRSWEGLGEGPSARRLLPARTAAGPLPASPASGGGKELRRPHRRLPAHSRRRPLTDPHRRPPPTYPASGGERN